MDKERLTRYLLNSVAVCVFIFSIGLSLYFLLNPHYFYTYHSYDAIKVVGEQYKEPSLNCTEIDKETAYNLNALHIQIYFFDCYMYNLPEYDPYIKEKNPFVYYIISNQGWFLLLYLIIFLLDEWHRYYYKKASYIRNAFHFFKH